LDGIYVEPVKPVIRAPEPQPEPVVVVVRPEPEKNPYMNLIGDYSLTDIEVRALKAAIVNQVTEEDRRILLSRWHLAKKTRLEKGLIRGAELPTVRAYFKQRVSDYETRGYNSSDEKAYADKTWTDYQWFTNKNG
jgi:hypothetical protein